MSRIGKQIIEIPQSVTVELKGDFIVVKGPKGELKRPVHDLVTVAVKDGTVTVDVKDKVEKHERALWGTFAAHIKNMIVGVSKGFQKQLEISGVGYKVDMQGRDIKLGVGYSHPVIYKMPPGAEAKVEKNVITITSSDKELLGSVTAEIRAIKKPEPYKGKGIKYIDEIIRRKAGKTAAKGE